MPRREVIRAGLRFSLYFVRNTMSGRGGVGGENFRADQQQVQILWPTDII